MKYYKLAKDLPTFEQGELFYMDDSGNLCRAKDNMLAYYHTTVTKFPNILEELFYHYCGKAEYECWHGNWRIDRFDINDKDTWQQVLEGCRPLFELFEEEE